MAEIQDKPENTFTRFEKKKSVESVLAAEIGAPWKQYREEWAKAESMAEERAFPVHMDFEVNNQCNLRCTMCDHGLDPKPEYFQKSELVSFEAFEKIVREGAAKGLRSINFNGINESLLVKNLEDYIALARDLGIVDLFLHTNATALTEKRSRSLIESGITRILFSIDGYSEETFNKIRIGAKFSQVLANIEGFLKVRREMGRTLPVTSVCFVELPANRHELEPFKAFWEKKVDTVVVQKQVGLPTDAPRKRPEKEIEFSCKMPWTRVSVSADGKIKPCCVPYNRDLTLGTIRDGTLEKAWTSPLMKRLRQIHKDGDWDAIPSCRDCTLAAFAPEN